MRIDRGLLNWGVFLIALGGIPLAVQQGWAAPGIAGDLWRLWPLVLVGIGLGLVLRWTPLAWLGGALVAGTLGVIVGALIAGGVSGIGGGCLGLPGEGQTTNRSGSVTGTSFELDVELSCGTLEVSRGVGTGWSAELVHSPGEPPVIEESPGGLAIGQGGGGFFELGEQSRNEWTISLPGTVALGTSITLNAAEGTLDLGTGPLDSLSGTFNASDVEIDLSRSSSPTAPSIGLTFNAASGRLSLPAASLRVETTLNASSLTVCVPAAVELRVEHEGTLSSDNLGAAGLTEQEEGWQTAGYGTATTRADVEVSSTVSSITLERPEVCS